MSDLQTDKAIITSKIAWGQGTIIYHNCTRSRDDHSMHNTYDCDQVSDAVYIVKMGVAHCIAPYTTEKSQSHRGFLPKYQSHRGILPKSQRFFSAVTTSQLNLGGHN